MDYKMKIGNGNEMAKGYASGGHHSEYGELAHFNPKELEILDKAQGGATYVPGTNDRHYNMIEENVKHNPAMVKMIMEKYEHHAKGGRIGELLHASDIMKKHGRNGDSAMAYTGPETTKLFNHLLGGGSVNPMTKKCEFFGLGNFMSNIGSSMKSGMAKAKESMSNMGNAMAAKAPGMMDKAGQFMNSKHGQNLMNGGMNALGAYASGKDLKSSLGAGVKAGTQGYDNALVRGAGTTINSLSKGKNIKEALGRGANAAARGSDNSMIRGAGQAAKGMGMGQDARSALSGGVQTAASGYDNALARGVGNAAQNFGSGKSVGESLRRGATGMARESDNPAVRGAASMANQYLQGGPERGRGALNAGFKTLQRAQPQEEYSGGSANDLFGGGGEDDFEPAGGPAPRGAAPAAPARMGRAQRRAQRQQQQPMPQQQQPSYDDIEL